MRRRKVDVHLESQVTAVEPAGDALRVLAKTPDGDAAFEVDRVLVSVGRRANVEDLGLDAVGVQTTRRGVDVDEHMQTNVPNVYVYYPDFSVVIMAPDVLQQLLTAKKFNRLEYLLPDEYRLDDQLKNLGKTLQLLVEAMDTEHFLTKRQELKEFFAGKKRYLMESFYRWMRKRYDVLMEKGSPVGGQWNYDQKNRQAYDHKVPIPQALVFDNDVSDILQTIRHKGVATFGDIRPEKLVRISGKGWPTPYHGLLPIDFL